MFTNLILDKLGVFYDDIAKKKHGNAREFTYGEIVDRIVSTHGVSSYKLFPEIGEQTFFRMMKKAFPAVVLNGGQETWQHYFLSIIEHKYCTSCSSIKRFNEFSKDKGTTLGITSICKSCRITKNAEQYKTDTTKEAHQRSYEKNYGKIRERQNHYKGQRSLRIPSWSQTDLIADYYSKCPEGYQVDHILPLKGELISGLHVIENLQYLTIEENLKKGNKFTID